MSDVKFKSYSKPNFTIIEEEPTRHKKLDIYYRKNSVDLKMIRECLKHYSLIDFSESDIVLDLGANVGGLGKMICDKVSKVISVEPDEFNFEVLDFNLSKYENCTQLFGAVTGNNDFSKVNFSIKDNANSSCAGKITSKNYNENLIIKSVNGYPINFLLEKYKPTILKIDVEGYEYNIIKKSLPSYIRVLALELHGMTNFSYPKMLKLYKLLHEEWNIHAFNPVFIFDKLRLLNIICFRREVKQVNYDLSYLDDKKINGIKPILRKKPTQPSKIVRKQIKKQIKKYKL